MVFYSTPEQRSKEKVNNFTIKNYGRGIGYDNFELDKFEPEHVSRKISLVNIDKYYEIKDIVDSITYNMNALNKHNNGIHEQFIAQYAYVLRRVKYAEQKGFYRLNDKDIIINNEENNLIIVLTVDPKFEYLNLHQYCLENNIDEKEYFLKKYNFYSPKLILMELYTKLFLSKNNILEDSNSKTK